MDDEPQAAGDDSSLMKHSFIAGEWYGVNCPSVAGA
jgi:hypothetical protein